MSNLLADVRRFSGAQLIAHLRTPLYRNAYALIVSDVMSSALGIGYWLLAARYYPAQAVGLNSAAISTMMFLSNLAYLHLRTVMIRFIPEAGRATGLLVGYAYLSGLAIAAALNALFFLGFSLWEAANPLLGTSAPFKLWFVCASLLWCIFGLQDGVLTGLRQTVWVPVENILFGIVKIVLLVGLAASSQAYGIFASWTIPAALTIVPISLLIFPRLIPRHVAETHDRAVPLVPRQIVRFAASDFAGSLMAMLPQLVLPLIVLGRLGASANAYFYLAWIVASALQFVAINMTTSLVVEGAADRGRLATNGRRVLIQIGRLVLPLVLVVVVGAPYLLRAFGADYAAAGTTLLQLLAVATIPQALSELYLSLARVRQQLTGMLALRGTSFVLVLGLSLALLPGYGITGIGMAQAASQTIVALVLLPRLRAMLRD